MFQRFAVDKEADAVSTGRNGDIKTHGVEVFTGRKNRVSLFPVSSRGHIARCEVEITEQAMTEIAIWWLFQRLAVGTVEVPIKNPEDGHTLTVTLEYNSNGIWIKLPGQEEFTACVDLWHQQYHPYEGSAGSYPQVLLYNGEEDDPVVRAMWKESGFEVVTGDEAP